MAKKGKNANYDFASQKQPVKNMGSGSFANLPDKPIMASYGPPVYRDGLVNSFTASLSDLSGIKENGR